VLIGRQGNNWWLAHRGQMIRAAPEQVRAATDEERQADRYVEEVLKDTSELLKGSTGQRQFVDLVNQEKPPTLQDIPHPSAVVANTEESVTDLPVHRARRDEKVDEPRLDASTEKPSVQLTDLVTPSISIPETSGTSAQSSNYGPTRHRITSKRPNPMEGLRRPPEVLQDDFLDCLRENIPKLIQHHKGI